MSSFAVRPFNNNYLLINCLWLIYKQFSLIVKHPVYMHFHSYIILILLCHTISLCGVKIY